MEEQNAQPSGEDGSSRDSSNFSLKSLLSLKTFLLVSASISLAFLITSFVMDRHILTHSGNPVRFERLSVDVSLPDSWIGTVKVMVTGKESGYKEFAYMDLSRDKSKYESRSIDDRSIETFLSTSLENSLGFPLPITTIDYAAWLTVPVNILQWSSIALVGLAIIFQLWFRADPDSFILRPGISSRISMRKMEMLRSGLPGFLLLMSACVSMILTVLVSSFIHNMVFRLVAYSIFNSGVSGDQLAAYRVAMKGVNVSHKQEQLKLMQYIGRFLTDRKHVEFGLSFYTLMLSIAVNLTVVFVLYWNDNKAARNKVEAVSSAAGGSVVMSSQPSQTDQAWKQLPWHCKVRPLWASILIFFIGMGVTAMGGNVARRRGVKMNRHIFEVDGDPNDVYGENQKFVNDVVISHTRNYFFSTGGIVDGAVLLFTPIMVMLAIVSLDRLKFASKVLELYGVVFFMRGLAVMATIMPTLYNVLQHPQCWDTPGNKLSDMLAEKEFCNDCMFSGHTVFCFLPALIFVFSIVYGPYSYKPLLISSVILSATALTSLIVIGRLHYTADVVVAIILTALLVIMNAPVWKLLFSFRKSQLGVGSVSAIDKVPGYLEMCVERLNLYTSTLQDNAPFPEDGSNTETWTKIDAAYAELGELIDAALADAEEAEREDESIVAPSIEEVVVRDDEAVPLLTKQEPTDV
jgi:hypothetical protein